jgi:hypothetical protein
MKTQDAKQLLSAMETLDVTEKHNPEKVGAIVLTARVQGDDGKPVSVVVSPSHPQWDAFLAVINGAVDANRQAAEAKLVELGIERTEGAVDAG